MEPSEFETVMAELRKEYLLGLPAKLAEVEAAWQTLVGGKCSEEGFRTFIRMAHNLAGSGATFGVAAVSKAAREVELYAKTLNTAAPPPDEAQQQVQAQLDKLRATILEG